MRPYACHFSPGGRDIFAPSVRAWVVSFSSDQLSTRDLKPFSPRWYRAPELLYGARQYDQGVDLW